MNRRIKVCIISSQIWGFGKIGGFAMMTRRLAGELDRGGFEVLVVVPRRSGQKDMESLGGACIYGVRPAGLVRATELFRQIDADIYHSQEPNLLTWLAMQARPESRHVVTCRDPRDGGDWLTEMKQATWARRLKTPLVWLFESGPATGWAVRRADLVGCPAHFLREKVKRIYGRDDAVLLPNIEDLPRSLPEKDPRPTVCWVGRLDRRKNPERALVLADHFPEIRFVMVGRAEDFSRQRRLETIAAGMANVEMSGYIDKFADGRLREIYARSRVLLNTAAREGLPASFIEAAGHGCAILSGVDPDGFASRFGYHAAEDDFEKGLRLLLEDDRWRERGAAGFDYVSAIYSRTRALQAHYRAYLEVLRDSRTLPAEAACILTDGMRPLEQNRRRGTGLSGSGP